MRTLSSCDGISEKMPLPSPRCCRTVGFTLVELLVVIGIISLLISILLPAVSLVRQHAQIVKCLSNMRQIGIAQFAYANNNNNYTVPAAYLVVPIDNDGLNTDNYATILVNCGFISPPLVKNIGDFPRSSDSIFYCPSGTIDAIGVVHSPPGNGSKPDPVSRTDYTGARCWRTESQTTGIIVDTWYGINADWNTIAKSTLPSHVLPDMTPVNSGGMGNRILMKLNQIPNDSQTVFLFDGIFYDLTYSANRLNARHNRNRSTNLLFFDGHAENADTASLPGGIGDANLPSNPFTNSNPPSTALLKYPQFKWQINY